MKTYRDFEQSLTDHSPPSYFNDLQRAVWYAVKGNWEKSHEIAQNIHTKDGSWLHAYLHRVEGDESNARYWYQKANLRFPQKSLQKELHELIQSIIN